MDCEMQTSHKGGDTMFPNLLGQKAYHKLTNDDMAKLIGISRPSYERKIKTGKFTVAECEIYMKYFAKSFDFLFATDNKP
nr:MAG TPA: CI repressor [Caudoviricetes sp.]